MEIVQCHDDDDDGTWEHIRDVYRSKIIVN